MAKDLGKLSCEQMVQAFEQERQESERRRGVETQAAKQAMARALKAGDDRAADIDRRQRAEQKRRRRELFLDARQTFEPLIVERMKDAGRGNLKKFESAMVQFLERIPFELGYGNSIECHALAKAFANVLCKARPETAAAFSVPGWWDHRQTQPANRAFKAAKAGNVVELAAALDETESEIVELSHQGRVTDEFWERRWHAIRDEDWDALEQVEAEHEAKRRAGINAVNAGVNAPPRPNPSDWEMRRVADE